MPQCKCKCKAEGRRRERGKEGRKEGLFFDLVFGKRGVLCCVVIDRYICIYEVFCNFVYASLSFLLLFRFFSTFVFVSVFVLFFVSE